MTRRHSGSGGTATFVTGERPAIRIWPPQPQATAANPAPASTTTALRRITQRDAAPTRISSPHEHTKPATRKLLSSRQRNRVAVAFGGKATLTAPRRRDQAN